MTCVTPSNPDAIPFGESQDISDTLARTSGGSLFPDGRDMSAESTLPPLSLPQLDDSTIVGDQHRVGQTEFLVAQTVSKPAEIMRLWKESIENARKAPLFRSTSKAGVRNLGSVVDQPLRKIRSIRFEQDEDEAALHPRQSPTPLRRRRTASSSRTSTSRNRSDESSVDFDDLDGMPEDFEDDENFSVHRPLSRMHV
jgi:DNA polymerase gamma 1